MSRLWKTNRKILGCLLYLQAMTEQNFTLSFHRIFSIVDEKKRKKKVYMVKYVNLILITFITSAKVVMFFWHCVDTMTYLEAPRAQIFKSRMNNSLTCKVAAFLTDHTLFVFFCVSYKTANERNAVWQSECQSVKTNAA